MKSRFTGYTVFELHLKADSFIDRFCPYNKEEVIEAIKILNEKNLTIEWLFENCKKKKNKDKTLLEIINNTEI